MPALLGGNLAAHSLLDEPFGLQDDEFDHAPFVLSAETSLLQCDIIFRMLGMRHVLIVEEGALAGVLTKKDLLTVGH